MELLATLADGCGVACVAWAVADIAKAEFLREVGPEGVVDALPLFFLEDLVLVPPTGRLAPEPRLRFLMTSVFNDSGRTTPCSLRKSPHALHSGWPSGFLRQSGVVWVKQLVQVVGTPFWSPFLEPPGLLGREGTALLKPDSCGEFGEDCGRTPMPCWPS